MNKIKVWLARRAERRAAKRQNAQSAFLLPPAEIAEQFPEIYEKRFKRRYRVFQIGFFLLLAMIPLTVYMHYDYRVFRLMIAGNYFCTDALEELYSRHIPDEHRRNFRRDFDRMVISVVTAELRGISEDRHTYLYFPQEFSEAVAHDRAVARTAYTRVLDDNTVYLYIPNITLATRDFVEENRYYLAGYANLVLDLRGNGGGWMPAAHSIANLFLPDGAVISQTQARLNLLSRTITAEDVPFFDFDKIVILQDRRTASAAETLIMAIAAYVPNVTTIGQTTFGKGTAQVTIPLTGGYALRATIMQVLGPDGQSIHNVGVAPDVYLEVGADFLEMVMHLVG